MQAEVKSIIETYTQQINQKQNENPRINNNTNNDVFIPF